jgi:hypothetical protein
MGVKCACAYCHLAGTRIPSKWDEFARGAVRFPEDAATTADKLVAMRQNALKRASVDVRHVPPSLRKLADAAINGLQLPDALLARALKKRQIPSSVFQGWVDACMANSFKFALAHLEKPEVRSTPVPGWVIARLPLNISGPNEAPALFRFLSDHRVNRHGGDWYTHLCARAVKSLLDISHFSGARQVIKFFSSVQQELASIPDDAVKSDPSKRATTRLRRWSQILSSSEGPPCEGRRQLYSMALHSLLSTDSRSLNLDFCEAVYRRPSLLTRSAAHRLSQAMYRNGVPPSMSIMRSLMYVESHEAGEGIGTILDWLDEDVIRMPTVSPAFLLGAIRASRRHGSYDHVKKLLDELHRRFPDVPTHDILLSQLIKNKSESIHSILRALDALESLGDGPNRAHIDIHTYVTAMQGALFRNEPDIAIQIWERALSRDIEPNPAALKILMRAYGMKGMTDWACGIVDLAVPLKDTSTYPFQSIIVSDLQPDSVLRHAFLGRQIRMPADIGIFNQLFTILSRAGRFNDIWTLWNTLEQSWDVRRDEGTLKRLLDAACQVSILAGKGCGFEVGQAGNGMVPRTNVDLWDGKQAWKVAKQIFEMDVLGENFPDIASTIRSPASGMPDVKGFFRSFSSSPGASKFDVPTSKVPHLYPDPSSFEAYINLLACFDGWSEIPVALAWMRTLNMEPQRRTLYTAILYFDDGQVTTTMIKRFRRWLCDWLGEDNVPSQDEVVAERGRRLQALDPSRRFQY